MTPSDNSCAPPADVRVTSRPRYFRFGCAGAPRGKLLIFYDSFMGKLIKYLVPFFRETVIYHRANFMVHPTLLDRQRPTVLIDEVVERKLRPLTETQRKLMQAAQRGLPLPPVWARQKDGLEIIEED